MKFLNGIAFNIIWFGCIYLGNEFLLVAIALMVTHLMIVNHWQAELILMLAIAFIGFCIDSLFIQLAIFEFYGSPDVIPLWLLAIWLAFAATLNHSLSFMKYSPKLQLLSGAFIVPLSYMAGEKFNAVGFGLSPLITFVILAISWLILLRVFFVLSSVIYKEFSYD